MMSSSRGCQLESDQRVIKYLIYKFHPNEIKNVNLLLNNMIQDYFILLNISIYMRKMKFTTVKILI